MGFYLSGVGIDWERLRKSWGIEQWENELVYGRNSFQNGGNGCIAVGSCEKVSLLVYYIMNIIIIIENKIKFL